MYHGIRVVAPSQGAMKGRTRRRAGLIALCMLSIACYAKAADRIREAPQLRNALAPDPEITFGTLPNGMRYELQPNRYPPKRVSLRLRMAVGSQNEKQAESGFAHFIEHMAFRGSAHFRDGEIMERLSGFGSKPGADTNASTAETQTVFRVDLPTNQKTAMLTVLTFFRDVGDRLYIDSRAVNSERRVILAEARLRETAGWAVAERRTSLLMNALHESEHAPLGTRQAIGAATADELRSFYQHNYRPDRATLVVVGDIDTRTVVKTITELFGSWRARGLLQPRISGQSLAVSAPEAQADVGSQVGNHIELFWMNPHLNRTDDQAVERERIVLHVGLDVLNRRFHVLAEGTKPPFLDAEAVQYRWPGLGDVIYLGVDFAENDWRKALLCAESVRRGVLTDSISEREVDSVRNLVLKRYQQAMSATATRPDAAIADELVEDSDEGRVPQSPRQYLEQVSAAIKSVRASTVQDALRVAFAGSAPVAFMTARFNLQGGNAELLDALNKAEEIPPTFVRVAGKVVWPYRDFGVPSRSMRIRHLDGIDATIVEFANGVRLNVKRTEFAKGRIDINVSIGRGRGDLPLGEPSLEWAADNAFILGGLKAIGFDELKTALAGKRYGAGFLVSDTAFNLFGSTSPADLDTQLQVLAAYCVSPGFRSAPFELARKLYAESLLSSQTQPYLELQLAQMGLMRSNDSRWAVPTVAQVQAARLGDFRKLLGGVLDRGRLQITIVGDVNVESAVRAVAKTFGAMKSRPISESAPPPEGPFPIHNTTPTVIYDQARGDEAAAAIAWPISERLAKGRRSAALQILADIMNARLSERLRIVLGTSYVSDVTRQTEGTPGGQGYLLAIAQISPKDATRVLSQVENISGDLKARSVTQDELDRAKRPEVARLEAARSTNGFWGFWLDQSQSDPRRLEFARNVLTYYREVSAVDVQNAAIGVLRNDLSWEVVYKRRPSEKGQ